MLIYTQHHGYPQHSMQEHHQRVQNTLNKIAHKVAEASYPTHKREWGGADVVITSKQPATKGGGFYPEPRRVVTPFSGELSWLFYQLRDAFADLLDSVNKTEFYGRLANAAIRYQKRLEDKPENVQDLLSAVLHEAFAILEEMDEGEFQYLLIASGNTIWDDLVERADRRGYIGIEETRQFFEEMERRHHDA
jgi:ABC-type cobalt transport system substrate-binding protein